MVYKDKAGNTIYGQPHNRIGQVSDWDGTLRTYKAEYMLRQFQPRFGEDMARIWEEQQNFGCKTIYDVQFPIFLEIPELAEFVNAGRDTGTFTGIRADDIVHNREWYSYYMTHWDLVDACADTWHLSPALKRNYPSTFKWFWGADIGEGWHNYLHETEYFLYKFDIRTVFRGALKGLRMTEMRQTERSHSTILIQQWTEYKQNYMTGKWPGGIEKFKKRLGTYLCSLVLGRDFQEKTEDYLQRTGLREFFNWAENETK